MARSLSLSLYATLTRLAARRYHSTKRDEAVRLVEEAVHKVVVNKMQPDWIKLVPGGSFWVPPVNLANGFDRVVHNLVKDSSFRNGTSHVVKINKDSNWGWPSSAQFFKGVTHCPLEGEASSKQHSNQSEEEEG